MKKCYRCGEEKPLSEYHKNKGNVDGYNGVCKSCRNKYLKEWQEKNPDKRQATLEKYRQNNQDSIKTSHLKWRQANKKTHSQRGWGWQKKNPDKAKAIQKRTRLKNKTKVLQRTNEWRKDFAKYSTYVCKIEYAETIKKDSDGFLWVLCAYCGQWMRPTNKECCSRVDALMGIVQGESRFYCTEYCKKACPTFNQTLFYKGQKVNRSSREVQPELRQLAMKRDSYRCQKCGVPGEHAQLHCHHIKPVSMEPIESADLDNVITLCKNCHILVHKNPGCNYYDLRCRNEAVSSRT